MRRSQLCQQLRSHLEQHLNAAPYEQGDDGEWKLSLRPMRTGLDLEPDSLAHLAFSVVVAATGSKDDFRNAPGYDMRHTTRLEVSFSYRLRPDSQITDWDLASDAAEDVVKLVFDEDRWAHGQCEVVNVIDGFTPQIAEEDLFLGVTLMFTMLFRSEV